MVFTLLFVPFGLMAVVEGRRARRAQRLLHQPGTTAKLHGRALLVSAAGGTIALPLWSRASIQAARQKAIPAASTVE